MEAFSSLKEEDLAKILFLAVESEVISQESQNELYLESSSSQINRLIEKFENALKQQRMLPVKNEVRMRLLKISEYKISETDEFTLESNFSDDSDILMEDEEDILEYTEIFKVLGYKVPESLKSSFDHIVKHKKIPVQRKGGEINDNKTFFVYTENKILMDVCDSLTTTDVFNLYTILRNSKGQKYEKEIEVLASALSIQFKQESLDKVPGLKDVAFYLLILSMIKRQLFNRLYTHGLVYLLKELIQLNEQNGTPDNNHRLENSIAKLTRYPVASKPPGLCLVFTMLEGRDGAQKDKTAVKDLFHDNFHYDVLCIDNPDEDRIKTIVTKLSTQRNKFYDSLIVVFMGHGTESYLQVKGGKIHRRRSFIEPFTKIKWLKKKPKLFFIQACAVRDMGKSFEKDNVNQGGLLSDVDSTCLIGTNVSKMWTDTYGEFTDMSFTNSFADTLISNATMWSQEASRTSDGSLYIHTLIDFLKTHGSEESVENVLTKVHYHVNLVALNSNKFKNWKQAPYFESSLQKQFVFPRTSTTNE